MHPQVIIIHQNGETGIASATYLIADTDPNLMAAAITTACGPEIGRIIAKLPTGDQPIGSIHQDTARDPHSDREFSRVSFAFVSTAAVRMSDAQRADYLKAVLGDDGPPAKANGKPTLTVETGKASKKKTPSAVKPVKALPTKPKRR